MPEIMEASSFASRFLGYLKLTSAVLRCQCQVCSDILIHLFPSGSDLVGVLQPFPLAILGLEAQESLDQDSVVIFSFIRG